MDLDYVSDFDFFGGEDHGACDHISQDFFEG
jgi:hypothetical protein